MTYDIEMVPTEALTTHPENGKFFRDMAGELWRAFVADIAASGIRDPLTVDRATGLVVKGNQRLRAALELGLAEVPVLWRDYADAEAAVDDLIRDNVMRRDLSFFEKYRLVAVLQERIESRQGDHEGNQHTGQRASVQKAPKPERPREQIAKLLGLHARDIAAANILSTLPEDAQAQFYKWAEEHNPSRKAAQQKLKELKKLKAEVKAMKDMRKMLSQKEELEQGLLILNNKERARLPDAYAATMFHSAIARGFTWLAQEAAAVEALRITPDSVAALAPLIREYMANLDAYRAALQSKFTRFDEEAEE
jgi:ParB-like chromosome segregation protein Spo0J